MLPSGIFKDRYTIVRTSSYMLGRFALRSRDFKEEIQ